MSATHPLTERASLPSNRVENRPAAHVPTNDNQPRQVEGASDHRRSRDWPVLAILGAGGVLTLGWAGVLVWGLWKLVRLAVS